MAGVGYSFARFQGVSGVSVLKLFSFDAGRGDRGNALFLIPTAMRRGTPKTRKSNVTCSLNKSN